MAGGQGTRLRPLTKECPKPLVPIANRPVAYHILRLLKENGFDEVLVTTHFMPEQMERGLGTGEELGLSIRYVREPRPLGTAGGVKQLEQYLDDTFLIISGDCLTDFRLRDAVDRHKATGADATIVVTEVENPLPFGIVESAPSGRIVRFLEKPAPEEVFSNTVNTGIYVLEPSVLERCPMGAFFDFSRDLFPAMLASEAPLYAFRGSGYWSDIGDCKQFIRSQIDVLYGKVRLSALDGNGNGVWIDSDAIVEPGATLVPPIMAGRGARISAESRVGPGTVLGPYSRVERGAVVERSVVLEGAVVESGATVLGAAVGRFTVVGRDAAVLEGAALGDGVHLEPESFVAPNGNSPSGKSPTGKRAPKEAAEGELLVKAERPRADGRR